MSDFQPQQPYQPYNIPPVPPPAPRRRRKGLTILVAAIGVLAAASVVTAIVGDSNSTNPVADATTTVTEVAPAPPAEITAPDVTIPEPTFEETTEAPPPPPAAPKVLLDQSGSGIKNTTAFTATGPWTLKYSFDCSGFGFDGNFIVTVADNTGGLVAIPVNALAASGADTSQVYDTGTLHLEVNSECDWHVTVVG